MDQFGDVRPCCQSTFVVGSIADQTLEEIWHGERLGRLREALADGDLSLGCGHCAWAGRNGRETTYAARYDDDPLPDPESGPVRLELAPSNACNLQCTMCNGDWSSAIRLHREHRPALPRRFGDAQLEEIARLMAGLRELHLFGGEPLLMPEGLHLLQLAADADVRCVITTNGTTLTPRVERLLDRPGVDVVVSVDGASQAVYEAIRVGADWHRLQQNLDRLRVIADRHHNELTVAHCLLVTNWHEFPELLKWAAARDLAVYVNDVTSPPDLSLHHLTPPELRTVVDALHDREQEIRKLARTWQDTWTSALQRMERTLADAATGRPHDHLVGGGPTPTATAPDVSSATLRRLADELHERRSRSHSAVRFALAPDLTASTATVVGRPPAELPLCDAHELVGTRSERIPTLIRHNLPDHDRRLLSWSSDGAVVERRCRIAGKDASWVERRSINVGTERTLVFEYWPDLTDADLRSAIETVAAGGAVVEAEISSAGALVSITPEPVARRLGLCTTPGTPYDSPQHVLEPRLLDPPPELHLAEPSPGITLVGLNWPRGDELLVITRAAPSGSRVWIATSERRSSAPTG